MALIHYIAIARNESIWSFSIQRELTCLSYRIQFIQLRLFPFCTLFNTAEFLWAIFSKCACHLYVRHSRAVFNLCQYCLVFPEKWPHRMRKKKFAPFIFLVLIRKTSTQFCVKVMCFPRYVLSGLNKHCNMRRR